MSAQTEPLFIDTGFSQCCYHGEKACGDSVAFQRIPGEERLIAVLADGLGHGLKANILSLMTTRMALRFIAADREIVHSAEIIMDSLPVCSVRKISYSTFTVADTTLGGVTRVVEMGNPPFLLFRDGRVLAVAGEESVSPKYPDRAMTSYRFRAQTGDRVILVSDGVTQAGLGTEGYPLGWRDGVAEYVESVLRGTPDISAQALSEKILWEAVAHEPGLKAADDISAVCLYYRKPHKLLLFTGPPFSKERDAECGILFREYDGMRVICGGTSAEIIARELGEELTTDLGSMEGDLPPVSRMKSADLVTEGIFTLTRTVRYLEDGETHKLDPAGRLAAMLRENDIIDILVGTKINEAHQDPNLPVDLELRRNIVKRLGEALRSKYMKDVRISFM